MDNVWQFYDIFMCIRYTYNKPEYFYIYLHNEMVIMVIVTIYKFKLDKLILL